MIYIPFSYIIPSTKEHINEGKLPLEHSDIAYHSQVYADIFTKNRKVLIFYVLPAPKLLGNQFHPQHKT